MGIFMLPTLEGRIHAASRNRALSVLASEELIAYPTVQFLHWRLTG